MADREQNNAAAQPNIVSAFSADLDNMFGLDNAGGSGSATASGATGAGVGDLEQTLEEKKQTVTSRHQQLQELEARLRETEERLARVSRGSSPARQADSGAVSQQPAQQQPETSPSSVSLRPSAAVRPAAAGREDTATMMSGMPGAMPQTPRQYSGSSDYVMVDKNKGERSERGLGQSVR